MRLYYSPGACSLASHIVLRETQSRFSLKRVNLQQQALEDGTDFKSISDRHQVPVLELDDGNRLSEGPVIMQYVADLHGASSLLPAAGSLQRWRVLEWCNYLTSEVHKSFTPIFQSRLDAVSIDTLKAGLKEKLAYLDKYLASREYLTDSGFTIADAYLFVLLGWAPHIKLDISDLGHLANLRTRVGARPAVREALQAEGLAT
jgi:glutathione S-transferase